jgi:hypothetical protein
MEHHMTANQGARPQGGGLMPDLLQKWVFTQCFGFLFINMPIFSGFSPFLGDIGHFWRPNSWRKLEMSNQLQSYIN